MIAEARIAIIYCLPMTEVIGSNIARTAAPLIGATTSVRPPHQVTCKIITNRPNCKRDNGSTGNSLSLCASVPFPTFASLRSTHFPTLRGAHAIPSQLLCHVTAPPGDARHRSCVALPSRRHRTRERVRQSRDRKGAHQGGVEDTAVPEAGVRRAARVLAQHGAREAAHHLLPEQRHRDHCAARRRARRSEPR